MADETEVEEQTSQRKGNRRGTYEERAAAFTVERQPKGYHVKISSEEWKLIHGAKPEAVYSLRPSVWRPLPIDGDLVYNTPVGPMTTFKTEQKPCKHCGARTREIYSQAGDLRCLGCSADSKGNDTSDDD